MTQQKANEPDFEVKASMALHLLIDAWESLPGGRFYYGRNLEDWLLNKMAPAIQRGRDVLGRPRPGETINEGYRRIMQGYQPESSSGTPKPPPRKL